MELGILVPDADGRFTSATFAARAGPRYRRRGYPARRLGAAIRSGQISLDFLDTPAFERFSALGGVTFAQLAERTGVPVDLLMPIREAAGSSPPLPDDRVREASCPYAEFIAAQVEAGFT